MMLWAVIYFFLLFWHELKLVEVRKFFFISVASQTALKWLAFALLSSLAMFLQQICTVSCFILLFSCRWWRQIMAFSLKFGCLHFLLLGLQQFWLTVIKLASLCMHWEWCKCPLSEEISSPLGRSLYKMWTSSCCQVKVRLAWSALITEPPGFCCSSNIFGEVFFPQSGLCTRWCSDLVTLPRLSYSYICVLWSQSFWCNLKCYHVLQCRVTVA